MRMNEGIALGSPGWFRLYMILLSWCHQS